MLGSCRLDFFDLLLSFFMSQKHLLMLLNLIRNSLEVKVLRLIREPGWKGRRGYDSFLPEGLCVAFGPHWVGTCIRVLLGLQGPAGSADVGINININITGSGGILFHDH